MKTSFFFRTLFLAVFACTCSLFPAAAASHAHTHQSIDTPRVRVFSEELQQQRRMFADKYALTPSVLVLNAPVTSVTVTIAGECGAADFLALFCFDGDVPHNTNLSFPFKFKSVQPALQQQQIAFDVLNVRLDCAFFLLRNSTAAAAQPDLAFDTAPPPPPLPPPPFAADATALLASATSSAWTLLAQSSTLVNHVKNACMGVHVALAPPPPSSSTDSLYSLRVFFSTTLPPPLTLQFHAISCTQPHCAAAVAPATVLTTAQSYSSADLCGGIAASEGFIEPGWLHTAELHALQPGATYTYSLPDCPLAPSNLSFSLPPPASSSSRARFIVYGDMGKAESDFSSENPWVEPSAANTTSLAMTLLKQGRAQAVVHIGDIAYAVGHAAQWDEFYDFVQPVASAVPYMQAVGNHEANFPGSNSVFQTIDSAGECSVPYAMRFTGGYNASVIVKGGVDPASLYYSFDIANAHVVIISTEHDFSAGGAQWQWLQADLAGVNRQRTPWVVVMGHRPMYIDSSWNDTIDSDQYVAAQLRSSIEPLLLRYKVNAAFWGHHHSFQRTCAVAGEVCVEGDEGVVHFGVGMGGMTLSNNLLPKPPSWSVRAELIHGLALVDAVNRSHLLMQFLEGSTGSVIDESWVTQAEW